jgi:hypothetical protein
MSEGSGETRGLPKKDVADSSAEQLHEAPLAPEVIEKIMEKVQDIDTEGLGFSRIRDDKAQNILKEGLLGSDMRTIRYGAVGNEVAKDGWGDAARNRAAHINFNIVGRGTADFDRENRERYGNTTIGGSTYAMSGGVFLLFALSKFKELEPRAQGEKDPYSDDRFRIKNYEFVPNTYLPAERKLEREKVDDEYGFLLSSRVAPRFFKGIILCPVYKYSYKEIDNLEDVKSIMESIKSSDRKRSLVGASWTAIEEEKQRLKEELERLRHNYSWQIDEDKTNRELEDLVRFQREANTGKPELLIPIYDAGGNLRWPEQMSHEEVKKFAAERAANQGPTQEGDETEAPV